MNQDPETHWPECFQWKFTPDPQPGACSHHLGTFCSHRVAFWAHLGPLWEAPLGAQPRRVSMEARRVGILMRRVGLETRRVGTQ